MSLGEVIRKARENMTVERKPSRRELADIVGVTPEYLQQLESGTVKSASVRFLKRYAKETGVSIDDLINEIEIG